MKRLFFAILSTFCISYSALATIKVGALTCEMLENPVAIDNSTPHFGWRVSNDTDGNNVTAYQVLVATLEEKLDEQNGEVSDWSEPASFGVGLLDEKDWNPEACFIGVKQNKKKSETAPWLRTKFQAAADGERYLLHVNSLGYHEAFVNGQPVSDAVLNPAVSQWGVRTRIVTYDVTSLVNEGENDLILWIGKGWYQTHNKSVVPGGPYVRAQLDVVSVDGVETLHPVSVHKVDDDSYIYDMGTCFVGFTEIIMPAVKEGMKITLHYEDYYLNDLADFRDKEYCDYFIGNGKSGAKFSSKFNYKGYRYLKIEGIKQPLPLSDITGGKVRTDYKAEASFECSDKDINAIYNMIHNTCHALTLGGYMVDCPQVERFGYGGDGNASTPTLQTLGNVAPLYMNWISTWADCQREDGGMPHTAPNPYPAGGGTFWCTFIIPASWQTYVNYGDRRLMERFYPNMQKWIGYAEAHTVDGILKDWGETDYRSWYLGDWAVPHEVIDQQDPRSIDIVSNCVLSDSYAVMAKIAAVLGKDADAKMYAVKHEGHNALIHKTFFDAKNNSYASTSQIDLV